MDEEVKSNEIPEEKEEEVETHPFESLNVCARTKESIKRLGFEKMTPIQDQAIPLLLDGSDLLGAAKTGSGKTLAFLIPAIEFCFKNNITPENGITVLVISPTRELALQTYEVAEKMLKDTGITYGLASGGTQKKQEAQLFRSGCNILIATPGRLVDHILTTKDFSIGNLKILILDEADRILEDGFKDQLHEIVGNLPSDRQTVLFSATQTKDVQGLADISFKQTPLYIGVDDNADEVTAANLAQSCFVVPPDKKFLLLVTILNRNKKDKKIMVFFGTRAAVKYHQTILKKLKIDVLSIHGDQSQQKRIDVFNKFRTQKTGILLCTDVAARGLDIKGVDWVIQFDPPTSVKEYIHRVGRAARAGAKGKALIILLPNERRFLKHLQTAKVPIKELKYSDKMVVDIHRTMEAELLKDRKLMRLAKEALKTCLMGYESHPMQDCFNVTKLDIEGVSRSFGFTELPQLDIRIVAGHTSDAAWIQKEKNKRK